MISADRTVEPERREVRMKAKITTQTASSSAEDAALARPKGSSVSRLRSLLEEKMDRTRRRLDVTLKASEQFREQQMKVDELGREVKTLRAAERSLQIRARQFEAENAALRTQVDELSRKVSSTQCEVGRLQQRVDTLQKAAAAEIGRIVKLLLPARKKRMWSRTSLLSEQVHLLVASNIIDPEWYLSQHVDVAAACIDPAYHYVMHGAEEGREARPFYDK